MALTDVLHKSLLHRLNDYVFGYDYFISYCWADGRQYAVELAKRLQEQGFECFLDSSDYAKGDNWREQGRRALRKTARLVLIATPKAFASEPVAREVEIFSALKRRIIPIDFDNGLERLQRGSPIARFLTADTLKISEAGAALTAGPTQGAVDALRDTFSLVRQQQKRVRMLAAAAIMFAAIALLASVLAVVAVLRQAEAQALVLTASGEAVFAERPLAGMALAYQGWMGVPRISTTLRDGLRKRLLDLAAQGRVFRLGDDVVDVTFTDDHQAIVARKHHSAELRSGDDLQKIQLVDRNIDTITLDPSAKYFALHSPATRMDDNYEIRRRRDGTVVGYQRMLDEDGLFPRRDPRYLVSDIGFSARIVRLSDETEVGRPGFDVSKFEYQGAWPFFLLQYRDDENTRVPPNADLWDVASGKVALTFPLRNISMVQQPVPGGTAFRFLDPEGEVVAESLVIGALYSVSNADQYQLWVDGTAITLTDKPTRFVASGPANDRYVVVQFADRAEVYRVDKAQLVATLPSLSAAEALSGNWSFYVTEADKDASTILLGFDNGQVIKKSLDIRVAGRSLRPDPQGCLWFVHDDNGEKLLLNAKNGERVLADMVIDDVVFARDDNTSVFVVLSDNDRQLELRRCPDLIPVKGIESPNPLTAKFVDRSHIVVNHVDPKDDERLLRSELVRVADGKIVLSSEREIRYLVATPYDSLLIVGTEDKYLDQTDDDEQDYFIYRVTADTYERVLRLPTNRRSRLAFSPDASNRFFIIRPEKDVARLYAIPEGDDPKASAKSGVLGTSAEPVDVTQFFHTSDGANFLLMAKVGGRLEIWWVDKAPQRIYLSNRGIASFVQLPQHDNWLVWFDDGRCDVLDPELLRLAQITQTDSSPAAVERLWRHLRDRPMTTRWFDAGVVADRTAQMKF